MKFSLQTTEKTAYCEGWKTNATTFRKQGCYAWMAEQLQPYKPIRVLDVGCGTGEGLAALLATSIRSIVAIEENFDCIKAAERNLNDLGYSVKTIPRIKYFEHPDGISDCIIDQNGVIEEEPSVTLVHADLRLVDMDKPLREFFDSTPKFDAVTIWLIGTTEWKKTYEALDGLRISNAEEYRLHLQNKIYKIADRILKPGGVLHVVDRGLVPDTDKTKNICIDSHKEQASKTSLCVSDFAYKVYIEPTANGIRMFRDPSGEQSVTDDGRRALLSIISKKPE